MSIIIVKGFTPESFAQELETEERYSSTTREEFFNEDEVEEDSIDFQAIYNAASDVSIMEKFINKHDYKCGGKKTNPSEIKLILTKWINGEHTPSNISITDTGAYRYKVIYFLFIHHNYYRLPRWIVDYADFSSWLKKRSRS